MRGRMGGKGANRLSNGSHSLCQLRDCKKIRKKYENLMRKYQQLETDYSNQKQVENQLVGSDEMQQPSSSPKSTQKVKKAEAKETEDVAEKSALKEQKRKKKAKRQSSRSVDTTVQQDQESSTDLPSSDAKAEKKKKSKKEKKEPTPEKSPKHSRNGSSSAEAISSLKKKKKKKEKKEKKEKENGTSKRASVEQDTSIAEVEAPVDSTLKKRSRKSDGIEDSTSEDATNGSLETPAKKARIEESPAPTSHGSQTVRRFQRVDVEKEASALKNERLKDNSYEGTFGYDGWGYKANEVLKHTRGKGFRHEKTKRKRGSYRGGAIDDTAVRSIKFEYPDEEE